MSGFKLVRDLVPARLAAEGLEYPVRVVADDESFRCQLRHKLREEMEELIAAVVMNPSDARAIAEEMGDVTEVMVALAAAYDVPREMIATARAEKFARSGGFDARYTVKFP